MAPRSILVAVLFTLDLLAVRNLSAAEPITDANWQRHAAIVEIRGVYLEVLQAEKAGRLRKQARTFEHCHAYDDGDREIHLDARGTVRSFRTVRGSDDSAVEAAYYYDRDGALRFVLAKAAAINGTVNEYRIYLTRSGERLWQERRKIRGPSYGFPSELPDDWLIRSPQQTFDAPGPCEPPP